MERLESIGFVRVGRWQREADHVRPYLEAHKSAKNVLYAFVVDGELKYLGKTVRPLIDRMNNYRYPGATQPTNKKNHEYIRKALDNNKHVDIFLLPPNELFHYGGFQLNLAAGLEDDLIRQLDPEWNGAQKETESGTMEPPEPPASE
jgi:hypothetical protein